MIVDYDSNIDDVVALSVLAKSPLYDIKAIVVTGTAFTNPSIGAANTYRLLELLGLANVDVGIGPYYTQPYWELEQFPSDFNSIALSYARVIPKASMFGADILMGTYDKYLPVSPRHVGAPVVGVANPKVPPQTRPADQPQLGPSLAQPRRNPTLDATTLSVCSQAADIYHKHVGLGDVRTVLCIGSMTSLHKFQVTYPDSFAKIETLYAMFGAVDVDGNVFHSSPTWKAEFNAIADPHSAKAVLSSAIPNIILVPLDATEEAPLSPDYMDSLTKLDSYEGRFVSELTHRVRNDWWCQGFNPGCFYGYSAGIGSEITAASLLDAYFFWDPLAVAVMIDPSVVEFEGTRPTTI